MSPRADVDALERGVRAGERRALAKAITLAESTRPEDERAAAELLERLLPATGGAARIGITGVPGVGKSTFIEAFGLHLVGEGKRVAVLAVDPSSSISGGSILGDKTRMPRLAAEPAAFIRPSPSGGTLGGVARRTSEAMLLAEAAGFDVVLVETVGVGQSEYAVAKLVDFFLVLVLAGAGDELQGIKRGILELADAIVVNKADGDNVAKATQAAAQYTAAMNLLVGGHGGWLPRVTSASSVEGRGMDEIWRIVLEHREIGLRSGDLQKKRAEQRVGWFRRALFDGLEAKLHERPDLKRRIEEAERAVEAGTLSPTEAARRVLARFEAPSET